MSLLISSDGNVSVIPYEKDYQKHIGGDIKLWSHYQQLDMVKGSNGKNYKYDIYVHDEGLLLQLPSNFYATCAAHPLLIASNTILGPAILSPLDNKRYTLEDWQAIKEGVVAEEDSENEDNTLADVNAKGVLAFTTRM